jgi:hypothetical protein
MPKYESYGTKEHDLNEEDKQFLCDYRAFNVMLRKKSSNPFVSGHSIEQHHGSVVCRKISIETEKNIIMELLRFHGWACKKQGEQDGSKVSLRDIIISYDDLFNFGTWLTVCRKAKVWTTNKVVQAVISFVKFMIYEKRGDVEILQEAWDNAKKLLAQISSSANEAFDSPSMCELRKEGKALSFEDMILVLQRQQNRTKYLTENENALKTAIGARKYTKLMHGEYEQLIVLQIMLKYPVRKTEAKKILVDSTVNPTFIKLLSSDRKNRNNSIQCNLSMNEKESFRKWFFLNQMLTKISTSSDHWNPFSNTDTTEVLKRVTRNMTNIPVTTSMLRTAVESYVESLDYDSKDRVSEGVNYIEGHSKFIAQRHYKRQGCEVTIRGWCDHISPLIDNSKSDARSSSEDKSDSIKDELANRMSKSDEEWYKCLNKLINDTDSLKQKVLFIKKRRQEWTFEQDQELLKLSYKFKGSKTKWKDIFESSEILQLRYNEYGVRFARAALKDRCRKIQKERSSSGVKCSRKEWTNDENKELIKLFKTFRSSKSKWKDILENSQTLKKKFNNKNKEVARCAIKEHYVILEKKFFLGALEE